MLERAIRLALIPPWIACASGFVFFSGIGLLTEATWGLLPPRGRRPEWH